MSSLIKSIVFASLVASLPLYACDAHAQQPTLQPEIVQKKEAPKPKATQQKKNPSAQQPKTVKKLQPQMQSQPHSHPRKKVVRKRVRPQYHVHHYYHHPREYRSGPYREYRQRPAPHARRYYHNAPPPSRVYRYRYYEPARVYYPAPPIGLNFVFGFR